LLCDGWRCGWSRCLRCALCQFGLGDRQQALRVGLPSARRRTGRRADRLNLGLDLGVRARGIGRRRKHALAGPVDQSCRRFVRQVAAQSLVFLDALEHTLLALVLAHRRSFPCFGISISLS
jgi:hypothetical protein